MARPLKILTGLFVYALAFLVIALAVSFWWLSQEFHKPGPLQEAMVFEVQSGEGLRLIAENLAANNIIEDPVVFMAGTSLLGKQSALKAGEYEFAPAVTPHDVMYKIYKGDIVERRFTIPEGLTSYEIVNILNGVEELSGEIKIIPEEGSLLPNTYDYKKNETRENVIKRMQEAMTETIDELWERRADNLPVKTKEEAINLAAIIEKETAIPEERKRVAGVFVNRLNKGIALQTDPTVIYAITGGKHDNKGMGPLGRRLLKKDLQVDSPYNTYKYPGLPPGPIANPGRASIEAALNPEKHNFIYFVADGSGGHIFAETLAEHNKNVAEWRKIRRQKAKE